MQFTTLTLLFAATGLAAAQTNQPSGCGQQIDNIISLCLQTTQAQLNACAASDWDCMCTQQSNVLTCYNNCPADPAKNAAEGQLTSWCNAAKQYGTSSSSMRATATSSGAAMSTGAMTTGTEAAQSSTSGSASSQETGAAGALVVPAGGVLAAVFGLAALI